MERTSDFLGLTPTTPRANPGGVPSLPKAPRTPFDEGEPSGLPRIPELDHLYAVMKDLQRAVKHMGDLEDEIEDGTPQDDHTRRLKRQLEFAYRSMNSWLERHG